MPPKKREKETDLTKSTRIDHIQADHELFLQAFEKPTQIYRYLRTRNMFQPMFLNRTLSYMKQRMSRSHKSREGFKVDSILDTVRQKNRNESQSHCMDNYMTLTFLGFYDGSLDEKQGYQIKVETLLLKICHKKRKDSSSAIVEVSVGCCSVPLNPSIQDPPAMASAVSISSEAFRPSQGPDLITYELLLRVAIQNPQNLSTRNNNEIRNGDSDEPAHKRSKPSDTLRELGSELIVYDKHNQCLLKAGEYDLELRDTLPAVRSPHKTSKSTHWETLPEEMDVATDGNPFEVFNKRPKLKLKLSWSQEPSNGVVSRPKPYQLRSADNRDNKAESNISNKENNRPSSNCSRLNNIMNKKTSADGKTNGHSSTVSSETKEACGETPQITYQFLYNNNSRQQTEACEDLHCPWCSIDCGTLYSLLKHLKFCHSRFSFTYTPIPKGARIDVAINDLYDGSYSGPPHATYNGGRVGPTRRSPLTHILVCKPPGRRLHAAKNNAPANNLAEFLESDDNEMADGRRPYMTGHDRLYHHTVTCLPVLPKELEGDSEEETDPLWLQQKTMMMIDEFTDVNEGEKELMKMWNLHVMKYNFVGDCQTQIACQMFLQYRGRELLEKNLYRNFILHMASLHDFGLITPVGLYQTVQMLNEILQETPVGKQKLRENILLQREHWKAVGMHQQPTVVEPKAVKPSTFIGFHGEASPVVRRKTSNLQAMNRMASSSYSAQLSAASGSLDSKKKNDASSSVAADAPQRRKSIPAPMISVVLAKNASSVPQLPLRRKSAGSNQAVAVQNRKRLSLEERKNST